MESRSSVSLAPPFLTADWRSIAMLNFPVDPAALAPHVPSGLELDFHHGVTYLSLVGFRFMRMKVRGIRALCHQNFDEVNLRIYVRRRVGEAWRRGVVFIKEIVSRRLIAFAARTLYNENYIVMPMRSQVKLPEAEAQGALTYEWNCGQRWHTMKADVAGEPGMAALGSEEEFITEHYWGYTRQRDGGTMEYGVEHPRWRIWKDARARFDGDAARLYPPEFVPFLSAPPRSALVAAGSSVVVRSGRRL
ncbi:MAG: DUF2071 domain-containing protein [Planctomycetes bacterium]|nr:DUF2071 domain-containing protein [Planctomycetota bacterium]